MSELAEVEQNVVVESNVTEQVEEAVPEGSDHNVSERGDQGGDTTSNTGSQMSQHASDQNNMPSSIGGEAQSNAPLSSRGSTRATGEEDSISNLSERGYRYVAGGHDRAAMEAEEQQEEDGSPILTNRFLRELFKKEWRRYYRTPELNEKLYLHFKGFSYMKNLAQFPQLKCLYFEGNGCGSLTGLEQCTMLRSLFIQENIIVKMEALDNLRELRQLNLNDNMVHFVEGLEHCEQLETLYLKRNRLGKDARGDIESLRGLLDRPSINTLDISDNYLTDPAIVDEILIKMPNLRVLYSSGNEFTRKCKSYRKSVIAKIPNLKYLDDRPVFEEDRRRAEAFVVGGIEAEREEMKKIKKEKNDKHWANHEAFQLMINRAREEKRLKAEAKEEKKLTMKEMMAQAKAEKSQQLLIQNAAGNFPHQAEAHQEGVDFFAQVDAKAKERYAEKQAGVEHAEPAIPLDEERLPEQDAFLKEKGAAFEKKLDAETLGEFENIKKKLPDSKMAQELQDQFEKQMDKEMQQDDEEEEDDECPPELEEVSIEELNRTKEQKNKEWLMNVVNEESKDKNAQPPLIKKEDLKIEEVETLAGEAPVKAKTAAEEEDEMVKLEEILLDEKKVAPYQKAVTEKDIKDFVNAQCNAAQPEERHTALDELD